jgi:hypothetical protein
MFNAKLVNKDGLVFDRGEFCTIKQAKGWAKGRGGVYRLVIDMGERGIICYKVEGNKFNQVLVGVM